MLFYQNYMFKNKDNNFLFLHKIKTLSCISIIQDASRQCKKNKSRLCFFALCSTLAIFVQFYQTQTQMPRLILITLLLISSLTIRSQSHYATYLNGFAPFSSVAKHCDVHISDNTLVISNSTSKDLLIVDTISSGIKKFKFYTRIANLNNEANKTYKYTDLTDNSTKKQKNPTWGISWGYIDCNNYYAAILKCHNSSPYDDIIDKRLMTINIIKVEDSKTSVLKTIEMDDGIDLYDGYNVVCVEYDGNKTSIAIGNNVLRYVAQFDNISYTATSKYGIFAGPAAKLAIERIVLRYSPIVKQQLVTNWNMQSLTQHFANSNNAYEGFWTFFDKDLDENKLRLGGRYTIALVKSGDGYDIIYVDGAQVNNDQWTCGMLKGHIGTTQFIDNYTLTWYDSTMRAFSNDVYATIENYTLLSLYFPEHKSYIRFAKAPELKK